MIPLPIFSSCRKRRSNPLSFSSAILATSPDAYYKFNDTSGTIATATVGTNGVYVGNPTLGISSLIPGGTTTFCGSSAAANYASVATLPGFGGNFTMSFVFKYVDIGAPQIMLDFSPGNTRIFVGLDIDSASGYLSGQLRVFTHDPYSEYDSILSGGGVMVHGKTYLLMIGRGVSGPFVLLNDISAIGSGSMVANSVSVTSQQITILQSSQTSAFPASSVVGHFALWNRALSPTECTILFNASGL